MLAIQKCCMQSAEKLHRMPTQGRQMDKEVRNKTERSWVMELVHLLLWVGSLR